jgi:hypothetical protein
MNTIANCASAVFAIIAALLWLWASRATVRSDYTDEIPEGVPYLTFYGGRGPIEITKTGKRIDVVATLSRQSKLNSCAAGFAAAAAFLQGITAFLPGHP